MVEIFSQHRAEVTQLRRDLTLSRLALQQAGLQPVELGSGGGEEAALEAASGVESTNSEVSWEAVEEGETRPTLWVPDHAASQCMGCHTQFWFGRRKHHCRSCGRLFCSECSDNTVPLPAEQLYTPVRVCDGCYTTMSGDRNDVIESCDIDQKASESARGENGHIDKSDADHSDQHRNHCQTSDIQTEDSVNRAETNEQKE